MVLACLLALVFAFGETLLPVWARQMAETMLKDRGAESAEVALESTPGILLLLGQVDSLTADAKGLRVGELRLDRVQLTGSGVRFAAGELYFDHRLRLLAARDLKLTGTVSADALRNLLAKRLDKLDNIKVTIDEEGVHATAEVRIFGRTADVTLEGKVVEDAQALYFHTTRLDIKNALIGKANIGDFFDDIQITKLDALPVKTRIESVEHRQGAIVVRLHAEGNEG